MTWRTPLSPCLCVTMLLALAAGDPADATSHEMQRIESPQATFFIDRHEVTIGQFRAFATATKLTTKAERDGGGAQFTSGWQRMPGWVWHAPYGQPGREDEPAVHVIWEEADAYCRWAGYRLPTDAEWVRAAYTETRAAPPAPFKAGITYPYPTGDSPDPANQTASPLTFPGPSIKPAGLQQGRGHLPARTTPPGVNGLWDMGANVWEWVDHEEGGQKRTRGGSWWYGPQQMRADALYSKPRDFPAVYIGFRCATGAR
jgi:formylglycine-generating enzyme